MTREELRQLLALLEKAERHAEQQYSRLSSGYWFFFWIDIKDARLAVRDFIDTSEAEA
jgi:hypothetical protein